MIKLLAVVLLTACSGSRESTKTDVSSNTITTAQLAAIDEAIQNIAKNNDVRALFTMCANGEAVPEPAMQGLCDTHVSLLVTHCGQPYANNWFTCSLLNK